MSKRYAIALAAASLFAFGANAQEASGNIMGVAAAGDTIEINAPDTGVHRQITVEEAGKYQFRRVPLGTYFVNVKHADGTSEKTKQVVVVVGGTARIQ